MGKINRFLLSYGTSEKTKYAGGNIEQRDLKAQVLPKYQQKFCAHVLESLYPSLEIQRTIEMTH